MLAVSCPLLFSRFGTGLNAVTMFVFSSGLAAGRLGQKCLWSQVEGLLGSRTRLPRGIQDKRHGRGDPAHLLYSSEFSRVEDVQTSPITGMRLNTSTHKEQMCFCWCTWDALEMILQGCVFWGKKVDSTSQYSQNSCIRIPFYQYNSLYFSWVESSLLMIN